MKLTTFTPAAAKPRYEIQDSPCCDFHAPNGPSVYDGPPLIFSGPLIYDPGQGLGGSDAIICPPDSPVTSVPEPGAAALLVIGLVMVAVFRRWRFNV